MCDHGFHFRQKITVSYNGDDYNAYYAGSHKDGSVAFMYAELPEWYKRKLLGLPMEGDE